MHNKKYILYICIANFQTGIKNDKQKKNRYEERTSVCVLTLRVALQFYYQIRQTFLKIFTLRLTIV